MIDLYQKGKGKIEIEAIETTISEEIVGVKITELKEAQLASVVKLFDLDLETFKNREDIEISSHYVEMFNQLSLNISVPSDTNENLIEEQSLHIILKNEITFVFISPELDTLFEQLINIRYDTEHLAFDTHLEFLIFQIGVISDYYADLVELNSKKIRATYFKTMNSNKNADVTLDLLTRYNFNSFLLRESVSEFQRIILLLRKKFVNEKFVNEKLEMESNDLSVVSEHIQYNFERVTDLKTNIKSKIEIEQNRIFKALTIITVCVSLPTLIAAIYGMNFKNMPELYYQYGYPIVIVVIILSFLLPLLYFKRNKWF